jgi:hypothetical protein
MTGATIALAIKIVKHFDTLFSSSSSSRLCSGPSCAKKPHRFLPGMTLLTQETRVTKEERDKPFRKGGWRIMQNSTLKKSFTKWVVGVVILPAVVLMLRKRIFEFIDEHM